MSHGSAERSVQFASGGVRLTSQQVLPGWNVRSLTMLKGVSCGAAAVPFYHLKLALFSTIPEPFRG